MLPMILVSARLSVCLSCSVTRLQCAKTAGRLKVSFGMKTCGPKEHCVRRGFWEEGDLVWFSPNYFGHLLDFWPLAQLIKVYGCGMSPIFLCFVSPIICVVIVSCCNCETRRYCKSWHHLHFIMYIVVNLFCFRSLQILGVVFRVVAAYVLYRAGQTVAHRVCLCSLWTLFHISIAL